MRVWLLAVTLGGMLISGAVPASASASGPVWRLDALADSTVEPGGSEIFRVEIANVGEGEVDGTPVTVTGSFPSGLKVTKVGPLIIGGGILTPAAWSCAKTVIPSGKVTCEDSTDRFPANSGLSHVVLEMTVAASAVLVPGAVKAATFEVSGGGADSQSTAAAVTIGPLPGFGLSALGGLTAADASGTPSTQAAGHPYETSVSFDLNTRNNPDPADGPLWPIAPVKDAYATIPPGLIGNPTVASQCTADQLERSEQLGGSKPLCAPSSQVGVVMLRANSRLFADSFGPLPLFNMVPPTGITARFGFMALGVPVMLDAKLSSEGGYRLTVASHNISEGLPLAGFTTTFWGVPASPAHDLERACPGEGPPFAGGPHCSSGLPPKPFLRNPTSCEGPEALRTTLSADSWDNPGRLNAEGLPDLSDSAWSTMSFLQVEGHGYPYPQSMWGAPVQLEGCDKVPVKGNLTAQTTALETQVPTGLEVTLEVPNPGMENPNGIASSDLKGARVVLPEGMTINPSQAEGLGVCSSEQFATEEASFHPNPAHGCPSDSKIGTVEVHSQLISETIGGDVFLAKPYDNQFHSLLAIYVVLKSPERGILVKIPGEIAPDPVTGRIIATFDGLPQLPFEKFTFRFRQGARAPLASPPTCGTYHTEAQLIPWSDPAKPITSRSAFAIIHGIGGAACPSGATPPFSPIVTSGSINANAATYTPFYLRIARKDGEQELTKFSTVLPPGLAGDLSGIPFCPDQAIEAARRRTGQEELASPSCPASSEIGHSLVGAGVGTVLAWTPGKIYLAGPYHGSALSIVSITSATVGPFDLGTVVIRFALRINPTTAQVEVDSAGSDPIPHILDGIVVHVKEIHVYIDRPGFTINPTNCSRMSIANTITGAGANPADPADQESVNVSTPFQVANCSTLAFNPRFSVSTSAKTSRADGASLKVDLSYPKAPLGSEANIKTVRVELPKALPSRLTTLQKACTDEVFNLNPANCPAASRIGFATATTPILPVPIAGPAYFVSHGGAKFPELIIVLQGYGVTIDLHGETFIDKAGITSTTFNSVPDVPVGSFELTLPAGPDSALAANGPLCAQKLVMPTTFIAQNGVKIEERTPVSVEGCKPELRVLSHSVKGKRARIVVSVPSAGTLFAGGHGLSRIAKQVRGAGVVTVTLRLSAAAQRFVTRHQGRRLMAPIGLSFRPTSGKRLQAQVAVLMR